MILNKLNLQIRKKIINVTLRPKVWISTQLIKKQQQSVRKIDENPFKKYPKTFQQKMMILNDPKMIQTLEIVQFGVKFKKGKLWFILLLAGIALSGYILQKILPIRVNDRYFAISPQSPSYPFCYLFSPFNFQKPFYLYLPILPSLYQFTKFLPLPHLSLLILANMVTGNALSQYLVLERVKNYQMWQNQRLCFGQGMVIGLAYAFWGYIGFFQAFTHLKAKIGLKTIRGKGIVRNGLPFGWLCVAYGLIQAIFWWRGTRNGEVVLCEAVTGILMGIAMRKIKPILK